MARYSCSFNEALSTTDDLRTLVSTATGQGSVLRLFEFEVGGQASAGAAQILVVNRPSANGSGAVTNVTPEKLDPASVAAAFSNASTFASSQPTLSTNDVLSYSFNAFGGHLRWVAIPDSEVIVGGQGAIANLSFRSRSGTGSVSGHILVEER